MIGMAWSTIHSKRASWAVLGHLHAKLCVLHAGMFPAFAWASGTRHCSGQELQGFRTLQLRMTCRLAPSGQHGSR